MGKHFELREGHEVRGLMIKLYPDEEQDRALRYIEDASRSAWNWLVKQTEDVLAARSAYAVRRGLVPPRPTRPDYDGMAPKEAEEARKAYRKASWEWHGKVHEATKKDPACAFRTFKELLTHYGKKYDYHLLRMVIGWREDEEPPTIVGAHTLQAIAKNYFQKSARRKKFRKRVEPMPIQSRSGVCFELGNFGERRGKPFFDCQIKFNGLKIRGRLPGRAPWGRVLEGVSITRKPDGWWASIKQEVPYRELPKPVPDSVIGIDVGLDFMAAMSNGKRVPNQRGRELSERIAGRQAQDLPVGRLHLKASRWTRHTIYNEVIKPLATFETIKIEALSARVGQMGSTKVSSMRLIREMLIERYGDRVREVDCRFTSQECSQCGLRSKESWSYEHGRYGKCPSCGYSEDRDVNAARNIASRPALSKAS